MSATPLLDEKLVAIERTLVAAGIPHAFGGANALAYYATPRATHDIDVNVFVPAEQAEGVLRALSGLGAQTEGAALREAIARDGQARVFWERTPIDLFFAYDPLHASSLTRRRRVEFGGDTLHVLSAEDLIVYKLIFDREKDWRDIAEIVYAADQPLDFDYVREWLKRIAEPDDARFARLEKVIASGGAEL